MVGAVFRKTAKTLLKQQPNNWRLWLTYGHLEQELGDRNWLPVLLLLPVLLPLQPLLLLLPVLPLLPLLPLLQQQAVHCMQH